MSDWFKGQLEEALKAEGFGRTPWDREEVWTKHEGRYDIYVNMFELRRYLREGTTCIEELPRLLAMDDEIPRGVFAQPAWDLGVKPVLCRLLQEGG